MAIRFEVDTAGPEWAVYVTVPSAGNDRALFLVFDSKEAALEAASAFHWQFKQYNGLFPQGSPVNV